MKENNEQNNQNPSEQITLLNGQTLLCYPKLEKESSIDNSLKLDTTGQYLSIGGKSPTEKEQAEEEKQLMHTRWKKWCNCWRKATMVKL